MCHPISNIVTACNVKTTLLRRLKRNVSPNIIKYRKCLCNVKTTLFWRLKWNVSPNIKYRNCICNVKTILFRRLKRNVPPNIEGYITSKFPFFFFINWYVCVCHQVCRSSYCLSISSIMCIDNIHPKSQSCSFLKNEFLRNKLMHIKVSYESHDGTSHVVATSEMQRANL